MLEMELPCANAAVEIRDGKPRQARYDDGGKRERCRKRHNGILPFAQNGQMTIRRSRVADKRIRRLFGGFHKHGGRRNGGFFAKSYPSDGAPAQSERFCEGMLTKRLIRRRSPLSGGYSTEIGRRAGASAFAAGILRKAALIGSDRSTSSHPPMKRNGSAARSYI